MTPEGVIIKGYKATDQEMRCRGFKFEIGKWYEYDGELSLCKSGFHFCEYPSGPWAYYNDARIFKCEAELVLMSVSPGADLKHVAKKIRLVEEILIGGDRNTGDQNTGDRNTGNRNTGDGCQGNFHSGDLCFGDAPYFLFGLPAVRDKINNTLIYELSYLLLQEEDIDPTEFLKIPNATPERIKALHEAHKAARKGARS